MPAPRFNQLVFKTGDSALASESPMFPRERVAVWNLQATTGRDVQRQEMERSYLDVVHSRMSTCARHSALGGPEARGGSRADLAD